jgi:hypothetical protein
MTVSIPLCWNHLSTQTQNISCPSAVSTPDNMSLQWSAPTLCDHARHQDSGLHNLEKHHVTCTTINSCYNTPNPHTGATPSVRLATTAYCYIRTYIITQSAPPTNYKEPTENGPLRIQVWMIPGSLYWPSWALVQYASPYLYNKDVQLHYYEHLPTDTILSDSHSPVSHQFLFYHLILSLPSCCFPQGSLTTCKHDK